MQRDNYTVLYFPPKNQNDNDTEMKGQLARCYERSCEKEYIQNTANSEIATGQSHQEKQGIIENNRSENYSKNVSNMSGNMNIMNNSIQNHYVNIQNINYSNQTDDITMEDNDVILNVNHNKNTHNDNRKEEIIESSSFLESQKGNIITNPNNNNYNNSNSNNNGNGNINYNNNNNISSQSTTNSNSNNNNDKIKPTKKKRTMHKLPYEMKLNYLGNQKKSIECEISRWPSEMSKKMGLPSSSPSSQSDPFNVLKFTDNTLTQNTFPFTNYNNQFQNNNLYNLTPQTKSYQQYKNDSNYKGNIINFNINNDYLRDDKIKIIHLPPHNNSNNSNKSHNINDTNNNNSNDIEKFRTVNRTYSNDVDNRINNDSNNMFTTGRRHSSDCHVETLNNEENSYGSNSNIINNINLNPIYHLVGNQSNNANINNNIINNNNNNNININTNNIINNNTTNTNIYSNTNNDNPNNYLPPINPFQDSSMKVNRYNNIDFKRHIFPNNNSPKSNVVHNTFGTSNTKQYMDQKMLELSNNPTSNSSKISIQNILNKSEEDDDGGNNNNSKRRQSNDEMETTQKRMKMDITFLLNDNDNNSSGDVKKNLTI